MSLTTKFKTFYNKIPLAVKASAWYAFSMIITKAINFLSMPLFTNVLSKSEYGIVNLFLSWESVLLIFSSLYLFYNVFINGMHKYKDDQGNFLKSLQIVTTVSTVLLFLLFTSVYFFIKDFVGLTYDLIVIMFIDLLFSPAFQFWAAKERYDFKYKNVVLSSILLCVLTLIANIASVYIFEDKMYAKIISTVVVNVAFCLYFYIRNFVKAGHSNFTQLKQYAFYALKFNLPLLPHFLSSYILNLSDRLMIGYLQGSEATAMYSVAYSIATLMIFINSALNQALPPWFYKEMDRQNYTKINNIGVILFCFISFLNSMMVLIAPEIIIIFSNREYATAANVVFPLASSTVFIFMIDYIANIEYYYDETKYTKWISIIPALVNLALNYLFIPKYGFVAAGYTTLISYMLFALIRYFYSKAMAKKHGVKSNIIKFGPICLISLISLGLNAVFLLWYDDVATRYRFFVVIILLFAFLILYYRPKIKEFLKNAKRKS